MTKNILVKQISTKTGKNGQYWIVNDDEGNAYSVWEHNVANELTDARGRNIEVEYTEKSFGGKTYKNIVTVLEVQDKAEEPIKISQAVNWDNVGLAKAATALYATTLPVMPFEEAHTKVTKALEHIQAIQKGEDTELMPEIPF